MDEFHFSIEGEEKLSLI